MDTSELDKVWKVWESLTNYWADPDENALEDRREYDADQLSKMYGLSEQGGIELADLIRGHFEPGPSWYNSQPTTKLGSILTEAIHNSQDGWPDWKKVIIEQYLNDLSVAAHYEKRDELPDS